MSYDDHKTFENVSRVNLQRACLWHPSGLQDWTPLEWAGAMCGEAGEAANAAKKLKRAETGLQQANGMSEEDCRAALAQEIGDTYLYLDLLAQRCGIDMYEAVRDTFNRVSEREGFPQRLGGGAASKPPAESRITSDPSDPRLGKETESGLNEAYYVLPEAERAKGFVRPVRLGYVHQKCGALTTMNTAIAETYARDPSHYHSTFCSACRGHFPVAEFAWDGDGSTVGS